MGNDMMEAYLYEMNTLLEQLDDIVLAAEEAKTFSQEDVNEIFRIMHTFKGSSAMMEFNTLMTVAHRIEDMFFIIRAVKVKKSSLPARRNPRALPLPAARKCLAATSSPMASGCSSTRAAAWRTCAPSWSSTR